MLKLSSARATAPQLGLVQDEPQAALGDRQPAHGVGGGLVFAVSGHGTVPGRCVAAFAIGPDRAAGDGGAAEDEQQARRQSPRA